MYKVTYSLFHINTGTKIIQEEESNVVYMECRLSMIQKLLDDQVYTKERAVVIEIIKRIEGHAVFYSTDIYPPPL